MMAITLKDKQILKESDAASISFCLPPGHLLLWGAFEKQSVAWVVEAKEERIRDVIKLISSEVTSKRNSFQFVKYIFATSEAHANQGLSQSIEKLLDAELKNHDVKVEGKLLRRGILKGELDFSRRRLRIEKKMRLMIVDDSKAMRDLLANVFSKDTDIEVVATVEHPHLAQKLIPELKPDVITLDIHMPDMDGVTLLKSYMSANPIPTIMISSLTMEEGPLVLNALEAGAVDYIQKPSFNELSALGPLMIEKVKEASRSKVKIKRSFDHGKHSLNTGTIDERALVVIGSSTGGTEALKQVFLSLPASIPPILVVQHIPAVFSKAFADRLNQLCPFDVKEAKDGDLILPNQVLIAPGGFQMEAVMKGTDWRVKVTDAPPMNRHKPSVDFLFDSLVQNSANLNLTAVILTGMGADGARGMKALKAVGAHTVAQDEATCVVFGMPKEAIRMGGVDEVLPLDGIASKIMALVNVPEKKRRSS